MPLGARVDHRRPPPHPHGPSRWGCASHWLQARGSTPRHAQDSVSGPQGRQVAEGRQGRGPCLMRSEDRTCSGGRGSRAARLQPLPLGRGLQPRSVCTEAEGPPVEAPPSSARYADLIPGWEPKLCWAEDAAASAPCTVTKTHSHPHSRDPASRQKNCFRPGQVGRCLGSPSPSPLPPHRPQELGP